MKRKNPYRLDRIFSSELSVALTAVGSWVYGLYGPKGRGGTATWGLPVPSAWRT